MSGDDMFEIEAAHVVAERIAHFKDFTFEQAAELPAATEGEHLLIAGTRCTITIYRQSNPHPLPGAVLLTVQVARRVLLGFASHHTERGLVFRAGESPREATPVELQNSDGKLNAAQH